MTVNVTLSTNPISATISENNINVSISTNTISVTLDNGIVDHGLLSGLLDDDHTQYFNTTRGDARYSQLGHTHTESDITDLDKYTQSEVDSLIAAIPETSPSGSNGQIQFNSSGSFGANANFVWDNSNFRLGIGTTGPDRKLDVLDASNPQMRLTHTDGSIYTDLKTSNSGDLQISNTGNCVFIGASSGNVNTSTNSTGLGYFSLSANTSGVNNTGVGASTLRANTTGTQNVALGASALFTNTTGNYNMAQGGAAMFSNTTGSHNTAVGRVSMISNTTGNENTAIGAWSLYTNSAKGGSVAIGYECMKNAHNTTTISYAYNTAMGYQALSGSTTAANNTGTFNTAIGAKSLNLITSGSNNIALGYQAGDNLTTESRNILIGGSSIDTDTTDDYLNIGNSIYGDMGTSTTKETGDAAITIDGYLDINSDTIRVRTSKTPSSASDTGTQGQIAWDSNYIYVCTATNTWVRSALSTW